MKRTARTKTPADTRTSRNRIPSRAELQEEVNELIAQRVAISEVLQAIASSPGDLQPIFDTILDSAKRLCRADAVTLRLCEHRGFRLVAVRGRERHSEGWELPELVEHSGYLGQVAATRAPVHIPDLTTLEVYRQSGLRVTSGVRTILIVPMLKEREIIGLIIVDRLRVHPFTEKQIELAADFAKQATIALQITRRERQYREVQTELAHANRVAVIGQLTASIVHELRQPLGAVVLNGNAGLRWLAKEPPDLGEVKLSLERVAKDARRGGDIITGLMDLTKKQSLEKEPVDLNEAIEEVAILTHGEAIKHGVSQRTQLAPGWRTSRRIVFSFNKWS